MPRNAARISEKRKEYMDACGEANSQSFQQRYHAEEVEERFGSTQEARILGRWHRCVLREEREYREGILRVECLGQEVTGR